MIERMNVYPRDLRAADVLDDDGSTVLTVGAATYANVHHVRTSHDGTRVTRALRVPVKVGISREVETDLATARLDAVLRDIGVTGVIVGTGGSCKAIEVRTDRTTSHILISNRDAGLPFEPLDGAIEIEMALYATDGQDDGEVLLEGRYASPEDALGDIAMDVREWFQAH